MTHVMLNSKKLSKRLWAEIVQDNLWVEAVNTACHTINRVYFHPGTKRCHMSYGKVKKKKRNVSYFHSFGSTCYILNDCEHLGKF